MKNAARRVQPGGIPWVKQGQRIQPLGHAIIQKFEN
jgi:hypothetical protein